MTPLNMRCHVTSRFRSLFYTTIITRLRWNRSKPTTGCIQNSTTGMQSFKIALTNFVLEDPPPFGESKYFRLQKVMSSYIHRSATRLGLAAIRDQDQPNIPNAGRKGSSLPEFEFTGLIYLTTV
jgi:hypothetical protein